MGNGGSHGAVSGGGLVGAGVPAGGAAGPGRQPNHWQHSLPSDPLLKASHLKVLPDLDQNARLRSTNNGAILQSGGTISGRRPLSLALPHDRDPVHNNGVYRSKSITQDTYEGERQQQSRFSYLSNQRDPLHRSHTHLHLEEPIGETFATQSKRFGSEPDLRNSQEIVPSKTKVKNMKKKYKAPPPPPQTQGSSSPDSWNAPHAYEHHVPQPPSRKLRLFKTRAETKKTSKHNHDVKPNGYVHHTQEIMRSFDLEETRHHPNDIFEQTRYTEREKLLRSPSRDRDEYLKYPSSKEEDMIQTQSSLKREENILQTAFSKQELIRTKHSQQNMYKEKAKGTESRFESNKGFRNSERFKKQSNDPLVLRREKSFDNSLVQDSFNNINGVNRMHNERQILLESQSKFNDRDDSNIEYRYKDREDKTDAINNRKSAPTIGLSNGIASAEFQAELLMATKKLRSVSRQSPEKVENSNKNNVKKPSYKVENDTRSKNINDDKNKDKLVLNQEKRNKKIVETNGARITATQMKSNIVTLDRSKQTKTADRSSRFVKDDKKEDTKIVSKVNGTKVLPTDKVSRENIRNRRESRVLADRGQASGKESTPEQSPSRVKQDPTWDRNQANQPSNSFYFGMDKSILPVAEQELDAHEKVRRHLEMNYKDFSKTNGYPVEEDMIQPTTKHEYKNRLELPQASSESALSSEPEPEDLMSEEKNPHGIALQLRPTLPKKQLEIPRFSPAAAWRQLASLEAQEAAAAPPPPPPPPAEERITRQQRQHRWARPDRGSHDKSGDSGISGDANNDDSGDVTPGSPPVTRREEPLKRPLLSAWTPAEDLEEESSSDAGVDSPHSANTDHAPAKFSARQQVFSLSLPRETHLAQLGDKNKQFQQPFNSLQKLRKSVSGAIGVALGSKRIDADLEENDGIEQAESNWFLSRSAPNSLNNGINTQNLKLSTAKSNDSGQQQTPPSSDQEDDRLPPVVPGMMRQQPPFSYLASGGHVMYLPRYDSGRDPRQLSGAPRPPDTRDSGATDRGVQPLSLPVRGDGPRGSRGVEEEPEQRSDGELEEEKHKSFMDGRMMSRSKSSGEIILSQRGAASKPRSKGKRFTFQSTVRQIERRRLAEKLSREAESKERQRLSELEAMRRVEEEFQRKRAREKASIRQQLRLVSLDESCSSLPSSWGGQGRSEPEGAVSPSPPPASRNSGGSGGGSGTGGRRISGGGTPSPKGGATPSPRIGGSRVANKTSAEYRQPREYKDYRRAPSTPVLPPAVHPPACYNMPRATPAGRTPLGGWEADPDNYRREFARGRRPPSSSGSDLSQSGRLLTPPRSG